MTIPSFKERIRLDGAPIVVTTAEYGKLFRILNSKFASPEGRDRLRAEALAVLGPERSARVRMNESMGCPTPVTVCRNEARLAQLRGDSR